MECFFPPTLILFSDNEESVAIQTMNTIDCPQEDSNSSINTTVSPLQIDLSSEARSRRSTVNTVRDVISNNQNLFHFSVITGLVFPYSANPKLLWKYRLMRVWVALLHVGYCVLLVTVFVSFILRSSGANIVRNNIAPQHFYARHIHCSACAFVRHHDVCAT